MNIKPGRTLLFIATIALSCRTAGGSLPESAPEWPRIKSYDAPPKLTWKPRDLRLSHAWPELMPEPSGFRAFHADTRTTNQVSSAYAPMFKEGWVAEPNLYIPEGPSFDESGHVYVVPVRPPIDVQLVSIDHRSGKRRFAIPGSRPGQGGAPLVLKDQDRPGKNIIYYGSYEYMTAVTSDGVVVWDVPTGLKAPANARQIDIHNFGVNYLARYDAVVATMGDGSMVIHDRASGRRLTKDVYTMPGARSKGEGSAALAHLPDFAMDRVNEKLAPLFAKRPDGNKSTAFADLIAAVVGSGAKVANYFGIDPSSGRMWVASTAADEADGAKDGESAYGAIYGLDFQPAAGGGRVVVHCAKTFAGGSASTPSIRADGKRVYFADGFGKVLAIDDDCRDVWAVDVGSQILGSLAVSDNNGEIYAAAAKDIIKIVESGNSAKIAWRSATDIFSMPLGVLSSGNLNLAGISANGIVIHVGAGIEFRGHVMPTQVGLAFLDRDTGKILYGSRGREESIAAMASSADGAVYLAHSPIRRAVAHALGGRLSEPVIGGVGKYEPIRLELLARDASCAAQYRAANLQQWLSQADANARTRELADIGGLIEQAVTAADASDSADLSVAQRQALTTALSQAHAALSVAQLPSMIAALTQACAVIP